MDEKKNRRYGESRTFSYIFERWHALHTKKIVKRLRHIGYLVYLAYPYKNTNNYHCDITFAFLAFIYICSLHTYLHMLLVFNSYKFIRKRKKNLLISPNVKYFVIKLPEKMSATGGPSRVNLHRVANALPTTCHN